MNPNRPNIPGQPPGINQAYHNYKEPAYVQGPVGPSGQPPFIRVLSNSGQPNPQYSYCPPQFFKNSPQNSQVCLQEKANMTGFSSHTPVPLVHQQPPPIHGNMVVNQGPPSMPNIPAVNTNNPANGAYGHRRKTSLTSHYSSETPQTDGSSKTTAPSPKVKGVIVDKKGVVQPAPEGYSTPHGTNKVPHIRKRSSTACDSCRQKKIKCDNFKPQCGACIRTKNKNCHYSSEGNFPDAWMLDIAYNDISSKLDLIMEELRARGQDNDSQPIKKRKVRAPKPTRVQYWDASITSLIKWPYLQQQLGINSNDIPKHIRRIVSCSRNSSESGPRFASVQKQLKATAKVEADFHEQFGSHLNAFLINSHTKVPFLDIVQLIELLEVLTMIKKAGNLVTLSGLLEEFYSLKDTELVGQSYSMALKTLGIEDSKVLQNAYRILCESMPVILMVCAIGIISAPVSLNNIGTYANSLEERSSMGPKKTIINNGSMDQDRFLLSQMYMNYASVISAMFPQSLKPNTTVSIKYHVLLSQYHHYALNPSMAHEEILNACNQLVFYVEKLELQENHSTPDEHGVSYDDALINRLYWTCLKLECELRVEMSPHIPFSFINKITPPSSFFRIPDPFQEGEHTAESVRLANSYDDQNTWYYFLTEIAVRKVENNMLDEIYPVCLGQFHWEKPEFIREKIWKLTMKYLNQLEGIVNSLTPSIREFVSLETDPAQIYASIKRKAARRRKSAIEEDKIPQILDDFLIDDDLLHHAQSESVIFIKTRILCSKMILMRPLIYMYLHDHILFEEILEAATEVLANNQSGQPEEETTNNPEHAAVLIDPGSEGSIYLLAAALSFLNHESEEEGSSGPRMFSTKPSTKNPSHDDFSDLMEYAESGDELEERPMVNHESVRKRVLMWFVDGLISVPKLTIPKLGLFRHPGSWYYIRNLILGVVMQFLIYKKTQGYVSQMSSSPRTTDSSHFTKDTMQLLSQVFKKEHVQTLLEYAVLITDYWKEERSDCTIYGEYLRQCLDRL